MSCLLLDELNFLFLVAVSESEPESDDSDSEPLDESELDEWLERLSVRRDAEFLVAVAPRRASVAGGEDPFLRFSACVPGTMGFGRFSMEKEMGLAARFSGGGG